MICGSAAFTGGSIVSAWLARRSWLSFSAAWGSPLRGSAETPMLHRPCGKNVPRSNSESDSDSHETPSSASARPWWLGGRSGAAAADGPASGAENWPGDGFGGGSVDDLKRVLPESCSGI